MADNLNISTTVDAWMDITEKIFRRKILMLDIWNTGALYDSLEHQAFLNSNGFPEKVDFLYKYYGIFSDMGVGKGVSVGTPGNVPTTRKAKPWKSKVLFAQVQRLSEILSNKYSIIGASIISENIINADKKLKQKQVRFNLSAENLAYMRRNSLLT